MSPRDAMAFAPQHRDMQNGRFNSRPSSSLLSSLFVLIFRLLLQLGSSRLHASLASIIYDYDALFSPAILARHDRTVSLRWAKEPYRLPILENTSTGPILSSARPLMRD